jgi:hypothetical protein
MADRMRIANAARGDLQNDEGEHAPGEIALLAGSVIPGLGFPRALESEFHRGRMLFIEALQHERSFP